MQRAIVLGLTLLAAVAAPLAASAQDRDDHFDRGREEHRIVGRVVSFQPYNLQLDRGPHIRLHNGTVIRPRGLTLRDGMPVAVIGHRSPDGFSADEIDLLRHRDGDRDRDRDRDRDFR